jgi:hypothetical protein
MEAYTEELMRRARKPRITAPVTADGLDSIWAMDLADMQEWHASNDGNRYILVVVDVFSRFAWCKPLKNKTAPVVWEQLQAVMDESKAKPKEIWVDQGTEFYNKVWTAHLSKLGIGRYSTYSPQKVSIAERFIQTIKHKIWRHFVRENTRKWIDVLEPLVHDYNTTKHSGIHMTPTQGRTEEKKTKLYALFPKPVFEKPKYHLNQWVRISRSKGIFEKGFHPTWSYEQYKIVEIRMSAPVRYYLVDYHKEPVLGGFYEAELQPVSDPSYYPIEKVIKSRTVKGVKEHLVKYLGYEKPKWAPASTLTDLD